MEDSSLASSTDVSESDVSESDGAESDGAESDGADAQAASLPAAPRCAHCDAVLYGPFCAQCGQEDREKALSVRAWFSELVAELADLDSRVLRTLRHTMPPGAYVTRYLEGHRVDVVSPVRLFFVSAAILLLLLTLTPGAERATLTVESSLVTDLVFLAREASTSSILVTLALVPVFAGLSRAFLGGASYATHLTFGMFIHAVGFLMASVLVGIVLMEGNHVGLYGAALGSNLLFLYLIVALRRVFGASWLRSGAAAVALTLIHTLLIVMVAGITVGVIVG